MAVTDLTEDRANADVGLIPAFVPPQTPGLGLNGGSAVTVNDLTEAAA